MSTEFINLSEIYLPTAGGTIDGDVEVGGAITVNDGSGAGTNYDVAYEISQLKAENEELKAAWDSVSQFSTSETNTGQTWIDGSAIYRRVFNFGAIEGGGTVTISTGLSGAYVVKIDCIGYDDYGRMIPVPFASITGSLRDVYMDSSGNLIVRSGSSGNLSGGGHVILEYIK